MGQSVVQPIEVSEKAGIQELEALLGFFIDLISDVVNALSDGKFGIGDAFKMIGLLKEGAAAFKNVKAVKDEIADLSDDEKALLETFIMNKLSITNPQIKDYVEQGIKGLLSVFDFVDLFKKKPA